VTRYLALLYDLGIEVSMSRTANCYDNAAMESFFANLTKECTDRVRFESRKLARSAIFEYFTWSVLITPSDYTRRSNMSVPLLLDKRTRQR
jgi:transposase InsO family protein